MKYDRAIIVSAFFWLGLYIFRILSAKYIGGSGAGIILAILVPLMIPGSLYFYYRDVKEKKTRDNLFLAIIFLFYSVVFDFLAYYLILGQGIDFYKNWFNLLLYGEIFIFIWSFGSFTRPGGAQILVEEKKSSNNSTRTKISREDILAAIKKIQEQKK